MRAPAPGTVFTVALLVAALLGGTAELWAAPPTKPNLVIFISDDHSVRDSSAYGSKDILTPNMERLAAAGMAFNRAFAVSPSCAPSRAAVLTGLMSARSGAEANHAPPRADIKKLPAYLQELGYEVVAFGKVAHYQQTTNYGFDLAEHCGFHEDIAVPAALKWLRERKSDKPLCLFVGSNWPHVPWPKGPEGHDPEALSVPSNHVDTIVTRQARARYYAAISRMDTELGQVYDLAREKLGSNLFFLHFADQGAQWPFGKWCLYDDGIRTPMLAVWPGRIAPGARSEAMVSLVDVLPTLVEAAGGKAPTGLDARSFMGVLLGKTRQHRDRIFATHSGDGNFNVYPSRCVRDERWKYILNLHPEFEFSSHVTKAGGGAPYWRSWRETARTNTDAATKVHRYQVRPREELYDLANDPWEQHNLADSAAQAERLRTLRAELEQWMTAQGDKRTVFGQPTLLPAPAAP
jgi:N-sulfoglucosamine sulfohydrolase